MKISAVCCTYKRPIQLGRMLACFLAQDHEDRELVILDDAGQYPHHQEGDRWRLVSVDKRFATLGAKRNRAMELVSPETELIAVWDDDDCYLPWALSATVAALKQAPWSRPSQVLHPAADGSGALVRHWTHGKGRARGRAFHAGWAFRRHWITVWGGYNPALSNGEDADLARRLEAQAVPWRDPWQFGYDPFLIVPWGKGPWTVPGESPKLSWSGPHGYEQMAALPSEPTRLEPIEPTFFDLHHPNILPAMKRRKF